MHCGENEEKMGKHTELIDGGLRKMARRDKALVDEMSATIILNDFLGSRAYRDANI